MNKQMSKPTVLNKKEKYSSQYILNEILDALASKTSKKVICKSMGLVQEVLFMYSREKTNNILVKIKNNSKYFYFSRHYDFYLRGNYAIIGAGKMCSTGVGRKSLVSRPKTRELYFLKNALIRQKILNSAPCRKLVYLLSL